jgi:general transcription factor 3C polypeptide 2
MVDIKPFDLKTSPPPLSSYVPEPVTVFHRVHARAKLFLLLAVLLLAARSPPSARAAIAAGVALATAATLPRPLARAQLKRVAAVAAFLFVVTAIGAEGVPPPLQARAPAPALVGLPPLPSPTAAAYSYVVFHAAFITITRRSLNLAVSAAATALVALQGSSLALTTTPAEDAARALTTLPRWSRRAGAAAPPAPANGATLTLLLSLRFMALVFDEARGLALGLAARGVPWRELGGGGAITIALRLVGRLFGNLQARAADVAVAMTARGFGGPGAHVVHSAASPPVSAAATLAAVAVGVAAVVRAAVASPVV